MSEDTDLSETKLSGKVLKILSHLYEKVESLEAFAKAVTVCCQSSTDAVIQSGDISSYMQFMKSAVVCTAHNARSMPQSWLLQQHSHQDEVILRVVERLRQREGRACSNLLVIGYRLMSEDSSAQIASSSRTIEYRIANSNTSQLQYTPWKTLLSRIGDDAMEFLLETRSVFVPAASMCYVQLTGTPMYKLWPFRRYYAQNQRNPTTQKLCTSLLHDSKYKSWRRWHRHRSKIEPTSSSKDTTRSIVQPCVSNQILSESRAALEQEEMVEMFSVNDCMETETVSSHNVDINTQQDDLEAQVKRCSVKKRKAETNLDAEPDVKRVTRESVPMSDHEHVVGPLTQLSVDSTVDAPCPQRPSHETARVAAFSRKRWRKRKGKLRDGSIKERGQKIAAFDCRLTIGRTPMFFSKDLTEKYPPKYVLFDANINSPLKLVADISSVRVLCNDQSSSVSCGSDVGVLEGYSDVKQRLLNILQLIIQNHQVCSYKYLLQHHCSFAQYNDKPAASSKKQTCEEESLTTNTTPKLHVPVYCRGQKPCLDGLAATTVHVEEERVQPLKRSCDQTSVVHFLGRYCSQRSVFLFVRACCLRVLPTELFGSATNRNKFFQNTEKVIKMRRYEQLSLGCLMSSMKVIHCSWMREIRSCTERLRLLAKVLCWLMNAFVMPLIKSYFYVTDSTTYRNRMFYYRKSLWRRIHQKGLASYMQKGTLREITPQEACEKVSSGSALGSAPLRFLPKSASLRPIVNLSKRTKVAGCSGRESTVNFQLLDLQNVLSYKRQRCPSIVGASVFSLDDIYTAWKKFVDARRTRGDDQPLYFVTVDIENCYDSIDQQKLYEIVSSVLQAEDYVVRRYVSVMEAGGRLRRIYQRDATSLSDFQPSFVRFVKDRVKKHGCRNAFFVDSVLHEHEDSASLLGKLRSHLFHNVVKVGRRCFVQSQGIAQGSAVSTLLCNIYYGKMEANYISVCKDRELLLRQVDDFLYVTPSYEHAVAFLTLMLRGIPEYNCHVNHAKTLCNFTVDSPGVAVRRLAAGALFPWCGLLFDTDTLAVVADYTRYAGVPMSDTLSVDLSHHAGRALRNKLIFTLRARCHRIFFDATVNSAAVQNVYRVFLLAAFKLHAYAAHLPNSGPLRNAAFLVDVIFHVAGFVQSSYAAAAGGLIAAGGGLVDSPAALQWLCFEAFQRKLSRHAGVYAAVLSAIVERQTALRRHVDDRRLADLTRIVGDDLPADFQYILP